MNTKSSFWQRFDFVALVTVVALVGYGLLMIYSATLDPESALGLDSTVVKQAIFAVLGFALCGIFAALDFRMLAAVSNYIYWATLASMILVLGLGTITHGSQRWFSLGFINIEPSEIAKIALCIALAKFLSDHEEEMHTVKYLALSALLVLPFFVLTMLQPNLGTALVYLAIWSGMVIMAGLKLRHALVLAGFGFVAIPFAWANLLHGYMRERVLTFLDPQSDPLGAGYNVIQAVISVGAGGLTGQGFTSGTQSQLHFLRVRYADFIFSVLAEELGFIGAMVLFGLFTILLFRALRIANITITPFGRYLAVGIVSMILFQIFTNVGMNIGVLPVTGVPLPFISYGGSSLIGALVCIGLLQSIALHSSPSE